MKNRKQLTWVFVPFLFLWPSLTSVFFLWSALFPTEESFTGFSYSHVILGEDVSFYILEVDHALYDIVSAKSQFEPLETVATIAKHHNAIAAVNGGFFRKDNYAYLPTGILKIGEAWYATPTRPRGAIGWSNSEPQVIYDQLLTTVNADIDGKTILIDGLNRARLDNQVILYNHYFHPFTGTSKYGVEFLIKDSRVQEITGNNSLIPNECTILSVGASRISSFPRVKLGSTFSFDIRVIPQSNPPYTAPEEWEKVSYIVGGAPILVRAGEVIEDFSSEQILNSFIEGPHARTAVGVLENGNWIFVVVDGKKGIFSNQGITIPALANLMKEIGCVEALNLDGGGSSTMVVNTEVVNMPSGEEQDAAGKWVRKVSDAILVIPK